MRLLKKLFSWLIGEIKQALFAIKDNLFLIIGVGLFAYSYSLFKFRSNELCEIRKTIKIPSPLAISYGCYDSGSVTILLAIGAMLIVVGILIIKRRKNEKDN